MVLCQCTPFKGGSSVTGLGVHGSDGFLRKYMSSSLKCSESIDVFESKMDSNGGKSGCRKEQLHSVGAMTDSDGQETGACGEVTDCCGRRTDAREKVPTFIPSFPAKVTYVQNCRSSEDSDECTTMTTDEISDCCSQEACCSKSEIRHQFAQSARLPPSHRHDVEKGTSVIEHVTITVEGLTCVGCENKLSRSLEAIAGIHNIQTSLILSQAEFDVSPGGASVSEIVREVTRTTGFACQRVNAQGHSLDIVVPGDARDFLKQKRPRGVEGWVALDKHTVRVTYDTRLIGARDLLEKAFESTIMLAPPRSYGELESGSKQLRKTALMTAFSAVLTIPVLVLAWAPLPENEILYGAISLVLATIVQVVVAGPFYSSALRALLFTHVIEMDLLVVLSTSTAYLFSIIALAYQVRGQPLSAEVFFETSTLLVTLIMLGRLISAFARHKAVESISVRSLQIGTALLVDAEGLNGKEIDARLLQYGDLFKVLPDCRIPTDGTVVAGSSEVDESNVTGEAVPVAKFPGSDIIAGCLNGSGTLTVRLGRLPGENTISEIAAMVDAAKFSKPKIQQIADRVASYFVPVIVVVTLIAFAIWIAVGKAVRHQSMGTAAVQAMTYAISVLIVSCPCAIGLAVPMVVVIAGGVGAKHGVIFKSAETIEIARKVSHVVFDKTGTLTQGELSVSAADYLSDSRSSVASLALGLTINSTHPVSAAVAAHLQALSVQPALVEDVHSVTGSGMEGSWNGICVRGGNSRWLAVQNVPRVASLLSQGLTVFCVMLGEDLLSVYGLDDSLRPDAQSVISELQKRKIAVSLVSGDDDGAVQKVGRQLGIPPLHIRSRCSPADKRTYIQAITTPSLGQKAATILFCGDGTNDAVALAQASIGLHMNGNSGSDIAQTAADAVLVRPALSGVLLLIDLSRAAFHRIVFNFAWSFFYNTLAVLLAAGAFVHVRIPPQWAGLGELVSVVPVVLVGVQLRWFRRKEIQG